MREGGRRKAGEDLAKSAKPLFEALAFQELAERAEAVMVRRRVEAVIAWGAKSR